MTALAEDVSAVDRFAEPLYSLSEASRFLGLPQTTFRSWARGDHPAGPAVRLAAKPVITAFGARGQRGAAIPFVGLAEGYALTAMRKAGVPLQRIRPALERLHQEMGIKNALASQLLYTDGAEVLFDYAQQYRGPQADAVRDLVVVRHGQRVFSEIVDKYLKRIDFGSDGYAVAIPLPGFERGQVVADVRRGFGQPTFARGGARLEDVLGLFHAGEPIVVVAEEFGLTVVDVEDALRNRGKQN